MATVSKETITVLSYKYLRVGVEEACIRRREFTFTRRVEALPRVHALVKSLLFLCLGLLCLVEAERVNAVRTLEELRLGRIHLNVFPSGMGPSARNEL